MISRSVWQSVKKKKNCSFFSWLLIYFNFQNQEIRMPESVGYMNSATFYSAAFRQYLCHTISSLLKIQILSHKPLCLGYNWSANISTKHCSFLVLFFNWRVIHATKTRITWQKSHSFGPFQFHTRKFCSRAISPVACTPRKVIMHMTSDFEVREIDPGMQISFLNDAP